MKLLKPAWELLVAVSVIWLIIRSLWLGYSMEYDHATWCAVMALVCVASRERKQ